MTTDVTGNASKMATLFSEERFVEAVARSSDGKVKSVKVRSRGGPVDAAMFGIEQGGTMGRRSLSFACFGLYAHPPLTGNLSMCVRDIIRQITGLKTTSFRWNVRYDHVDLAKELQECGLPYSLRTTHVLELNVDYETTFSGFNATTRNHVRRALREGVVVRRAEDEASINAYYEIHKALAQEKGNYDVLYGIGLFRGLLQLREDVVFLVAEVQNRIVAGGWFFRDGDAFFYWHGAMDRAFSKSYPMCAVFDRAIQLGCRESFSTFNFGGSAGLASLEQFKASWGAVQRQVWQFSWCNPVWHSLSRFRQLRRIYA